MVAIRALGFDVDVRQVDRGLLVLEGFWLLVVGGAGSLLALVYDRVGLDLV